MALIWRRLGSNISFYFKKQKKEGERKSPALAATKLKVLARSVSCVQSHQDSCSVLSRVAPVVLSQARVVPRGLNTEPEWTARPHGRKCAPIKCLCHNFPAPRARARGGKMVRKLSCGSLLRPRGLAVHSSSVLRPLGTTGACDKTEFGLKHSLSNRCQASPT